MTAPEIRPATELKPCPLCGEESAVGYSTGFKRVRCNSCFCGTEPSIEGPEKAISRWNTRPIEDSLRAAAQERDRQIAVLEQERDDDTALIRRLNATVATQAEEIERLTEKAVKAALGVNFECQEHTSGCDATMTVLVSSESRVFRAGLHDVLRQVADAIRAALKPESKE